MRRGAAFAVAVALVAAHQLAPSLPGSALVERGFANLVLVTAAGLAGRACWRRSNAAPERTAWRLLATYAAVWALGKTFRTIVVLSTTGPAPFPTLADLVLLGATLVGILGAARLASSSTVAATSRRLLDGLSTSLSLLYVAWAFVMGPLLRHGAGGLEVGVAFAFPALDAAMVTAAILTLPELRRPARRSAAVVLIGLCAIALADGAFAYLAATERFVIGTLVDLGWLVGFLLVAGGATATERTEPLRRAGATFDRARVLALIAPLLMIVPAIVTSLIVVADRGGLEPALALIGLATVSVLLVRQALTLRESEARAQHLARRAAYDALTGTASREHFASRLDSVLREAPRTAAVVLIDLDDFKHVNDRLGHAAGDSLLVEVSQRLSTGLREDDLLARLGGDEFAILVSSAHATAEGLAVAERVREMSRIPIAINGRKVTWPVSIGLAVDGTGHESADSMLRDADLAMYAAKRAGKDRYEIYEPHMLAGVIERLDLVHELERAVERDELVLFFQPTLDLATGAVTGAEALLRWEHPERGLLRPPEFLEVAEGAGLMPQIGRRVLEVACGFAGTLRSDGLITDAFDLCINVAPLQLADDRFVDDVAQAIVRGDLPASMIVLELTESTLIDRTTALPVLRALKGLGVWLAVDDFGTGYSSLSYLQHLPVDILKIDRSFVSEVDRGVERQAMVRAIISIAQSLHLLTIAEGIERTAQADQLLRLGCSLGQGYLYAEPLPPEDFIELLRNRLLVDLT